jgi:hypothetical protein
VIPDSPISVSKHGLGLLLNSSRFENLTRYAAFFAFTPRHTAAGFCERPGVFVSLPQSSKFFHSLSITSIFDRLHGVLNVGKKIINYTV